MKKIIYITLAFAFIFANKAQAEIDKSQWQFYRTVDAVNTDGLVDVILPPNMIWKNSDLSDLRIVDESDNEVPYLYSKFVKAKIAPRQATIVNNVKESSGETRFVMDMGQEGNVVSRVEFDITNPNFRRQVKVYSGSQLYKSNSNNWSLISDKGYIYSISDNGSDTNAQKTYLEFSGNSSRYLMVVIGQGEEGPLEVRGARYSLAREVTLPKYNVDLMADISQNKKNKTTEVLIDRRQSGLVTNSLNLNIGDKNFVRKVVVEVADDYSSTTNNWSYVNGVVISKINTSIFSGGDTEVRFADQNKRFIKLTIVNEDNPPLNISNQVSVGGTNAEVIFESKSGKSYKIYYGNKHAVSPRYDISRLSDYIEKNDLPLVGVGQEMGNPGFVPDKAPVVPFTERNKTILNVFLVIIVIIIGIFVGLYLRKYSKNNNSNHNDGLSEEKPNNFETGV